MLGWTQEEIGELYEVTQQQVSNITNGFTQVKTLVTEAFNQGSFVVSSIGFFQLKKIEKKRIQVLVSCLTAPQ